MEPSSVTPDFGLLTTFNKRLTEIPPRHGSLLDSNDVLPALEKEVLRNEASSLNQYLESIRAATKYLLEEERRADNALNQRNGVIAPVRLLPPEILSEIFKAGALGSPLSLDPLSFPIVVSQVSRRWRLVALSTPSIWSHIRLDASDAPPKTDKSPARYNSSKWSDGTRSALQIWNRRARYLGAHLTFRSSPDLDTGKDQWRLFCSLGSEWRTVDATFSKCDVTWAHSYHQNFRNVHKLTFELADNESFSFSASFAALRHLWLGPMASFHSMQPKCFPWHRLTHLELSLYSTTFSDALECINLASNSLTFLALRPTDNVNQNGLMDSVKDAINLSALQTLQLHIHCGLELDHFLVPNLRTMNLQTLVRVYDHKVWELLIRSCASVQALHLLYPNVTPEELQSILHGASGLVELTLVHKAAAQVLRLLSLLHGKEQEEPILPSLAKIELRGPLHGSLSQFIPMVTSRSRTLTSVIIDDKAAFWSAAMRESVKEWKEAGIDVILACPLE